MKAWPLKVAAQYAGGLLIAAFFAVLLSFTFSFLGTIFCAALAGMMLGALRTRLWQSIPVSLLFPLIIVTLMRGMKTELAGKQISIVALACFSVFWLTYVVAAALFFFERKGPSAAGSKPQIQPASAPRPGGEGLMETATVQAAGSLKRNSFLTLEMLEGKWSAEGSAQAQDQQRRMSIEKENLILSVSDSEGGLRILGRAHVKLCAPDTDPTLLLSTSGAQDSSDTVVSI